MYYTVIKHDGHLRTRGKCRQHEPQAEKRPGNEVAKIGDKLIGCCAFVQKSIEDNLPMIPS